MALLIAVELMTMLFAIHTLSSVRALVSAEGLWSKAEKDAVYNLQKYGASYDEADYLQYSKFLKVNLGDRKTRLELLKPEPDMTIAREGFLEGRFHPDDIDGAIKLLRRFHSISYISHAIEVWTRGDNMISSVQALGEQLHAEIRSANPSREKIQVILTQIDAANTTLTGIEDDFSYTLGEGSRWLTGIILKLLFCLVLTVEISGLSLTIFVSRNISKGLGEIIDSSVKISGGYLEARARVFSRDEIGILARSFNEMANKLEQNINNMRQMESERIKIIRDIVQRKNNLEQFSYIVSHNLRSPIANIIGITDVLRDQGHSKEEEHELIEGLSIAIKKLDDVIRDLNQVLKIKNEGIEKREQVKFSEILEDIRISNASVIRSQNVKVTGDFSAIDEIFTVRGYLYSIFFNLISNSIKYQKMDVPPLIEIISSKSEDMLELVFKDNGIGMDLDKKEDQVFGLYKRFHTHVEGRGVGLFMVKTQVETLGGTISVSSEVNKGTQFSIRFKAADLLN